MTNDETTNGYTAGAFLEGVFMSSAETRGAVAHDGVLEEMTIDEIRAMRPEVVVWPFGSTEPHGPHLPTGTDTIQVTAMSRAAVAAANRRGGGGPVVSGLAVTEKGKQ